MKRILASYRWRRRLVWLAIAAAVAGGLTAIALLVPNTRPKEHGPSNVAVKIEQSPKPVRFTRRDQVQAQAVAASFLHTAVVRKNLDRSWDLVSPSFRAGFTRKQWDSGDMPVIPYPARGARWSFDYSDTEGIVFSLSVSPRKGFHRQPQDFQVGLRPVGSGTQRRWLVDYWEPLATGGGAGGGGGGGGSGSGGSSGSGSAIASGKATESIAWLAVPLGLLSLVILIPAGIVTFNWYRGRRARRALS